MAHTGQSAHAFRMSGTSHAHSAPERANTLPETSGNMIPTATSSRLSSRPASRAKNFPMNTSARPKARKIDITAMS